MPEYRPNVGEASMVNRLDRVKEHERTNGLRRLRDNMETVAKDISIKLIEGHFVETNRRLDLEDLIYGQLEKFVEAEDFEVQYQIANVRRVVPRPNTASSLYNSVSLLSRLLVYDWIEDIYGTDEELYNCVDEQISKFCTVS